MNPSAVPTPNKPNRAIVIGLYLNAALILLVLVVLLSGNRSLPTLVSPAMAQQGPIAGGAGVFVMPAQLSTNAWGCYLLDVDAQTLATYQYSPAEKMLRFVAARNYRFDRRMENFNTAPSPSEIRDLNDKMKLDLRNANPSSMPSPTP